MKVRKATLKDAKGIAKVLVKSYNIKDIKEGINIFECEIKKSHNYIVSVKDGKIAGIISWVVHGLPKHRLCELDRIAVIPLYRGVGVSKILFNALIKDAKKYYKKHNQKLRKLYLLTHGDNIRAHKFYEKIGFEHESTLKEHYYKNRDEYVYSMFF